LKICSQTPT